MTNLTRSQLSQKVRTNCEQTAQVCSQLVQIPSETPPSDTRQIAEVVGNMLRQVDGAEVSFHSAADPILNVVARIKGSSLGRRLVFNGHLDTFPIGERDSWTVDPFSGAIKEGRLYGRGAADMKGGIASYISAINLLSQCREAWRGELVITLAGDEESMGVRRAKYLLDTVPHASGDAMISGDIGTSKVLRFGEKGLLWFELIAVGKPGHGAHVHRGVNAVERLIEGMIRIRDGLKSLSFKSPDKVTSAIEAASKVSESYSGAGETRVLQSVTINYGVIEGGISPNLIPARAITKGDIRIPVGLTIKEVEARIRDIVSVSEGLSFKVITAWEPNWSDPDHEIFSLTAANCRQVWGTEVVNTMRVGASDARLYRLLKGVPSVNCGLNGYNLGGPDEYLEISDLMKVTEIHTLTAFDFLSRA